MALQIEIEAKTSALNEVKQEIKKIKEGLLGLSDKPFDLSTDEAEHQLYQLSQMARRLETDIQNAIAQTANQPKEAIDLVRRTMEGGRKVLEDYAKQIENIRQRERELMQEADNLQSSKTQLDGAKELAEKVEELNRAKEEIENAINRATGTGMLSVAEDLTRKKEEIDKQLQDAENAFNNNEAVVNVDTRVKEIYEEVNQLDSKVEAVRGELKKLGIDEENLLGNLVNSLGAEGGKEAVSQFEKEVAKAEKQIREMNEALNIAMGKGSDDNVIKQIQENIASATERAEALRKALDTVKVASASSSGASPTTDNNVTPTIDDKGIASKFNDLKKSASDFFEKASNKKEITAALDELPPRIKDNVKGFQQLIKVSKLFLSSPLGIVLGLLVVAFKSLTSVLENFFSHSTSGFDSLNAQLYELERKQKVLNKLEAQWLGFKDAISNGLGKMGEAFIQGDGFFDTITKMGKAMGESVGSIKSETERLAKIEEEALNRETMLQNRKLLSIKDEAKLNSDIANARDRIYSSNTDLEKLSAIAEAQDLIKKKYQDQIEEAKEELEIHKLRMKATNNTREDIQKHFELESKIYNLQTQSTREALMLTRQESSLRKQVRQKEIDDTNTRRSLELGLQKERLGMLQDEHDKEIALLRHSEKEQKQSLKQQADSWRNAQNGVLKGWQAEYIKSKTALIEEQTALNIARKEADFFENQAKEIQRLNAQLEKDRLALQDNSLEKTLQNIEIEKQARLQSLEEQRKAWLKVQKELTEEQQKYIEAQQEYIYEADTKKREEALSRTYEDKGNDKYRTFEMNLADARTLKDYGYEDNARIAQRRAEEALRQSGQEMIEDSEDADLKQWLADLDQMSLSNLQEQFLKAKDNYQSLLKAVKNGTPVTKKELQKAAGQYEILSKKIKEGTNETNQTIKSATKGVTSMLRKIADDAGGRVGEIFDAFAEVSDLLTDELIPAIKSFGTDTISAIQQTAEGTMEGVQATSEATSQAIQAVERASVILAIIQVAIKLLQVFDNLFGGADNRSAYDKAVEQQKEINKKTQAVYDYERAVREAEIAEKSWFSQSTFTNMQDQWKLASEAMNAYYKKANEQQVEYQDRQAGRTGGKVLKTILNPVGAVIEKIGENIGGDLGKSLTGTARVLGGSFEETQYGTNTKSAIDNLRFETQARQHGTWFRKGQAQETTDLRSWAKDTYGKELFDASGMIDVEMANNILENYEEKLVGETKETLEKLKEEAEAYQEAIDNIKSAVSDMYSPLIDNMSDAVWNWLETSEDALDTFKRNAEETFKSIAQQMIKTMTQKLIFSNFDTQLEDIAEKYAKGDLTEAEMLSQSADVLDNTMKTAESALPQIQQMALELNERMKQSGIDMTGTDEVTATAGGFETMSEQTATELSGRFTALYQSGLRIEEHTLATNAEIRSLAEVNTTQLQNCVAQLTLQTSVSAEIQNTLALSYLELQTINENSDKVARTLTTVREDIEKIRKVTDTL